MRIGIVARNLGRQGNGVRRYILSLIGALVAIDQKNEYVIYYDQESYLGKNPSVIERAIKMPTRLLWDHIALPVAVKRDGIDVLLCTRNVVPPLVTCKSMVTIYDISPILHPRYYNLTDSLYLNLGIRWSIRKSNAIIAISQNTKADLVSKLGANPAKIHCVYLAMDENYQLIEDRARLENVRDKYNLPSEFILSVSSLEPRKNLPKLIKAFSLAKERPEVTHKLVMIGSTRRQHLAIFNEMRASPVREEIVWLNFVPEEDLPAIYNLATLFVFPSLYEGFGLPLLEAMACGCPVVCSNTSSLPEIAGDAAILVDPTSIEQLADGICRVLTEDNLRNSLIKKGLKTASSFSWERAAKETLEVFEAVYKGAT